MTGEQPPPVPTFFFPYRDVSGVPVLFSRMARFLAESLGSPVRVVDYPDGHQSRVLASVPGIELIPFADGVPVSIRGDSVLVMQGIVPSTIRRELAPSPTTRVLFWTLHPMNWIQTLLPIEAGVDFQIRHPRANRWALSVLLPRQRANLAAFLKDLDNAGALRFMDGTTLDSTAERLGIQFADPRMLPVPVDTAGTRGRWEWVGKEGVLRVAWLGRLADFKLPTLLHLMERLDRWATETETEVELHVIGEGPEANQLSAAIPPRRFMTVHRVGRLTGAALDEYLLSRVDLLAAMGTSALEGARLGIPAILLDIAYAPLSGDHPFRWLHTASRFTLGEIIVDRHGTSGDRTLEIMLGGLRRDYSRLSEEAYSYCVRNHDLSVVAVALLAAVKATLFRWGDIPHRLTEKSAFRKAYEWGRSRHPSNR